MSNGQKKAQFANQGEPKVKPATAQKAPVKKPPLARPKKEKKI